MVRLHPILMSCAVVLAGCREDLPPLEAQSQHARVGSDVVGQICGGTLAWVDATSEYVGERLQVSPELTHDVYFVSRELADEYCKAPACTGSFGVVVRAGEAPTQGDPLVLRETLAHELTHSYTRAMLGLGRRAFIEEGLADAVADVHCMPTETPLATLLEVKSPYDLWPLGGYCAGANFMDWLLEVEGAERVMGFHEDVCRRGEAEEVMDKYERHFGRSMQDDYDAHNRPVIDRQVLDCLPEVAPRLGTVGNYRVLSATTECSDPRVENDFANVERVQVSWRLTITEAEAGPWQVSGSLGPDVEGHGAAIRLGKNGCVRRGGRDWAQWWAGAGQLRDRKWLGPGTYTVQVSSLLDEPAVFEAVLAGPCKFGEDDQCRPGDRCDGEVCVPQAPDPLPVGARCSHDEELGDPCTDDARCVGPLRSPWSDAVSEGRCVALCTTDAHCQSGQRCHADGLCGNDCSVDDSICAADEHCVFGWGSSPSVCLPGNDDAAREIAGCRSDTHCPSGLVCSRPRLGAGQIGCSNHGVCECTQPCVPANAGRECPSERPLCVVDADGRRASCQPG